MKGHDDSSGQSARFAGDGAAVGASDEASAALRLPRFLYYLGMALIGELSLRTTANLTVSDAIFFSSLIVLLLILVAGGRGLWPEARGQLNTVLIYGVLLFTVGGIFSSFASRHALASLGVVARFAYLTVVWFWLGAVVLRTLHHVVVAVWWWISSAALTSLAALGQSWGFIPQPLFSGRPTGLTDQPNDLGAITAIALLPAFVVMMRPSTGAAARAATGLMLCSVVAGLSLSGSIGALVASAGAWLLWVVLAPSRKRYLVATAAVAVAVGIWWSATQDVSQTYSPVRRIPEVLGYGYSEVGTAESRVYIDQTALQRIWRDPILGHGLDLASQLEGVGDPVHNMLLLVWFGAGLLGVLGLLIVLLSVSFTAYSTVRSAQSEQERSLAIALSVALVAFLLVSMSQPIVFVRHGWVAGALLIALRAVQLRRMFWPSPSPHGVVHVPGRSPDERSMKPKRQRVS